MTFNCATRIVVVTIAVGRIFDMKVTLHRLDFKPALIGGLDVFVL